MKKIGCFTYRTQILVGVYVVGVGKMRYKINESLKYKRFPQEHRKKVKQEKK